MKLCMLSQQTLFETEKCVYARILNGRCGRDLTQLFLIREFVN